MNQGCCGKNICKPVVDDTGGDVVPGVVDDKVGGDVVPTDVVTVHRKPYILSTSSKQMFRRAISNKPIESPH